MIEQRFRKKPVEILAWQYWPGEPAFGVCYDPVEPSRPNLSENGDG